MNYVHWQNCNSMVLWWIIEYRRPFSLELMEYYRLYICIYWTRVNTSVYSTTLAGSSFQHTNINIYNEGHNNAAI